MAGGPGQSADHAGGGEPFLAVAVRERLGEDGGGFRLAGRAAAESGVARLAGFGVRGEGMGRQGAAQDGGHERDLPAVVEGYAGAGATRSGESTARARSATATIRRDGARP